MESGDSEYEEEEVVVLAELNGLVDDELLRKGCTYQFVGIDTDKPVLQLGKYNFLGSYEDQMGSALFVKQSTDEEGHKTWSKQCFSDKKLSMQRVFLRKKGEELPTLPGAAAERTAMEEASANTPETAKGQQQGKEPEPGSSSAANEKQPEQTATAELATASAATVVAVAPDEAGSDVDMSPAEDTDTDLWNVQSSADDPLANSEP